MRVFDWLRRLFRPGLEGARFPARPVVIEEASNQEKTKVTAEVTLLEEEGGSGFATPADVVEEAFDQIMAEMDVLPAAANKLRPLFAEAHRSGDPRKEIEAVEAALDGLEWGERYFGAWRQQFERDGAFPYMWQRENGALSSETPPPPATLEEAVDYLRVADMRQLLTELGAMPERGRPRKRAEFITMLSTIGEVAAIIEKAMPRYHDALDKRKANRERHKENLLAHTISMRAYSLRDQQTAQRLHSSGTRSQILRPFESHCPVEREYAARFMAGEIKGHPPFFPGDRTSFICE